MPKLSKDERRLLSFIPQGSERPRTLKELTQLTGWSSRRVRDMITRLIIRDGLPIGSTNRKVTHGYFIITNETERMQALNPLVSQVSIMNDRIGTIMGADLEPNLKENKKPVKADYIPPISFYR